MVPDMRWPILYLAFATPAFGWDVKVSGPVCLLTHEIEGAQVTVSHDPRKEMPYAIDLGRDDAGWSASGFFAMQFNGPEQLTISTDRHMVLDEGRRLIVEDYGFGNVLNGLAFNHTAIAIAGEQTLAIPLQGAAPKVEEFRTCLMARTS